MHANCTCSCALWKNKGVLWSTIIYTPFGVYKIAMLGRQCNTEKCLLKVETTMSATSLIDIYTVRRQYYDHTGDD